MSDLTFKYPVLLWGLIIPLLLMIWYLFNKRNQYNHFVVSQAFTGKTPFKVYVLHALKLLEFFAMALLIVAMARPQSTTSWQNVNQEGIDIIMALDISGSMLAEDLKPNRLEASKEVALDFIKARKNDRMGLVIYSGESFTQCPLTTDHSVLKNLFEEIQNGMIEDGTAIGMGLATAVNRLKQSEAKSKVVILLTDGSNNSGDIPPSTAADIAQTYGVRVYTIGVGTNGMAPFPMKTVTGQTVMRQMKVVIDEETLKDIANKTDGKYFRATDNASLKEIYKEIDELEKSKIEVTEFRKRKEEFKPWVLGALLIFSLSYVLDKTWLRKAL